MLSFFKYFFSKKEIVIGKEYIMEDNIGCFRPFMYVPLKINNTHVLYKSYYKDSPFSSHEGESKIESFRAFYVPYE